MAKTIAMINMKGGVGKTTLTVNIAYALAKLKEKKVLLVDADPQFNATQYLLQDELYLQHLRDGKYTVYDIFVERSIPAVSTVSRRRARAPPDVSIDNTSIRVFEGAGRLDLIPSELRLLEAQSLGWGKERRLATFLSKVGGAYDYVLIDCPPTISIFTLSAYLASEGYLVPVKPDPLSTVGLPLLEKVIRDYTGDYDHEVRQIGIVPTMVRDTKLMGRTLGALRRDRGPAVFTNVTSYSTYVAEAVEAHLPLFDYPPAVRAGHRDQIVRITEEFLTAAG
jgi:chromosome partitioning protein